MQSHVQAFLNFVQPLHIHNRVVFIILAYLELKTIQKPVKQVKLTSIFRALVQSEEFTQAFSRIFRDIQEYQSFFSNTQALYYFCKAIHLKCIVSLCFVLTTSGNSQDSSIFGILFIQVFSDIFKHIQHYHGILLKHIKDIIKTYSSLLMDIQNPVKLCQGIFRTLLL